MKKRIISIFLIMSLIISMFAVSAIATSAASNLCVAPTIRSTINRIESLNVNWNSIQNATYYTLWVRSSFTGKWNGIKTKNGTTTYANYNWIRPGEKVDLKVSAVDKNGIHSEYSEIKTVENTSNVASKLATPTLLNVRNVGPLGRELTWNAVKGAKWYRVFYKNANGKWLSKYTTTQTRFYDTYPTAKGDTYTVACVTDNSANWYPLSGYDPVGKSITAKCLSYDECDEWAVGKVIKIAGANRNAQTSGAEPEAKFYKDLKGNEYNFNIPNGTAIRVAGVEYIGNNHTSANGRFKINYLNKYVGYVKMNYCLIDVGEYIPSATIALSFAAKNSNSYVNKYNQTKSSIGVNETVNMFNYNNEYVPGISNYYSYHQNRAWARYDVTKKLLLAQIYLLRKGFSLKIYDAYRPFNDTVNIKKAWTNFGKGKAGQIAYPSIHNTGAAFDVSIIYEQAGVEAIMPTKMHDLSNNASYDSWKHNTSFKGEHARTLRDVMTSKYVGFDTYDGEWWHFDVKAIINSNNKVYYNCGN